MADPTTIANTGVDPTTGSYLSKERRIAIFRTRNVRASEAGFGGPQTSAIVVRQNNTIVQLQKEIGTLRKSQSESIAVFQKEIGTIQNNIQVIAANIKDLGGTIRQSNVLLSADAELEKKEKLQEQIQEAKLAEEGVRFGKESQLEAKLQNALLSPIRFLSNKAQSVLSKLQDALVKFFLGWLTINILDLFRAESQNNQNLVGQIFGNIISSITAVFKTLQVINKTFKAIIGTVVGVTKLLAKFLTTGVGLLFKGLGKLATGAVSAGKNIAEGAGKIAAKVAGTEASEQAAKVAVKESGEALGKQAAEAGTKALVKSTAGKFPIISLGTGLFFGGLQAMSGNWDLAAAEVGSGALATIPGWGTALSFGADVGIAAETIRRSTQKGEQTKSAKQKAFVSPTSTKSPATPKPKTATPTTTMAPVSAELSFDASKMMESEGLDFSKPAEFGEVTAPIEPGTYKEQTQQASITPAKTQRIPTPPTKVGVEPEAKPNIVMLSSVPGMQGAPDTVLKSSPGGSSDVPFISSSNPDNFYALYSQVNYNVLV